MDNQVVLDLKIEEAKTELRKWVNSLVSSEAFIVLHKDIILPTLKDTPQDKQRKEEIQADLKGAEKKKAEYTQNIEAYIKLLAQYQEQAKS